IRVNAGGVPARDCTRNHCGLIEGYPRRAPASSSFSTSAGQINSIGKRSAMPRASAFVRAIRGPVLMTTRSAMTREGGLGVGVVGLEIAHGYAGTRKQEQELYTGPVAEFCGLAGSEPTHLVELGCEKKPGFLQELSR